MPVSSTLAVDTTSLLLATAASSADSAVTADIHSSVVKRPAENDEELSSGDALPAYKVPKLTDNVPMTVAGCVKPGSSTGISTVFHNTKDLHCFIYMARKHILVETVDG